MPDVGMLQMLEDRREYSSGDKVKTEDDLVFKSNLKQWINRVINGYMRYGTSVNKEIANIAQVNNLNNEQISRIVEEVNTQIYLHEYNKQRNSLSRDVDFEIADLQKIKDIAGNDVRANKEAPKDPAVGDAEPEMPKKASLTDIGDSLNFLNFSSYDTVNLSEDKKVPLRSLLERDLAEKIASMNREYDREVDEFSTDVYCFAEALVKYAQHNLDHQEIFSEVCKEAELLKGSQLFIKSALDQRVEQLKERKELPSKFSCSVDLVDTIKKDKSFSLGEHSLAKQASNSNKQVPIVITDKKLIKDTKALVDLAKSIQKRQEKLIKKTAEIKELGIF